MLLGPPAFVARPAIPAGERFTLIDNAAGNQLTPLKNVRNAPTASGALNSRLEQFRFEFVA